MYPVGLWGSSNTVGWLYHARESRFGSNQKSRGVVEGDLVLCYAHAGDHFYDYILVRRVEGRLQGCPDVRIGSYSFPREAAQLSTREYHLLAAGESIATPDILSAG